MARQKTAWDKLSMNERAQFIKLGLQHGLTDLNDIKGYYNLYSNGGSVVHKFDGNTEETSYIETTSTPTKEQYIAQQLDSIRNNALERSRNKYTTDLVTEADVYGQQYVINREKDDYNYYLAAYNEYLNNAYNQYKQNNPILSEKQTILSQVEDPDIIPTIDYNLRTAYQRLDEAKNGEYKGYQLPNCITNLSEMYPHGLPYGNRTFANNPQKYGFTLIDTHDVLPGDLVQHLHFSEKISFPNHAMLYNGLDSKGQHTFNYSDGNMPQVVNQSGDVVGGYGVGKHYPDAVSDDGKYLWDVNVYRYTGTPQDSIQWSNEWEQQYGTQKALGGQLAHKKSGEEQEESQDLNSSWLPQFAYTPSTSQQQVQNTLGIEPMTAQEQYTAQEVSKEIDNPGYTQAKVQYNNSQNQQYMHIVEQNPGLTTMGETPLFNTMAGFMPVLGDAMQGAEAIAAAKQGDYMTAGLLGGMMLLPNIIQKPIKKMPFLKRLFGRTRTNPKNLESTINPIQGDDAVAMFRRWDPGENFVPPKYYDWVDEREVKKARDFYKLGDDISDEEIARILKYRARLQSGRYFNWRDKQISNPELIKKLFDDNGNLLMQKKPGYLGLRWNNSDTYGTEADVFIIGDRVYKIPHHSGEWDVSGFTENEMGPKIARYLSRNRLGEDLMPPLTYEGYIQDIEGLYRPIFSQEKLTPMPPPRNGFFVSDYDYDNYRDKRIYRNFRKRGIKPTKEVVANTHNGYITKDGIFFNDASSYNMGYDKNGILKIFDPYVVEGPSMGFSPDFDAPIDFSQGFTYFKGGKLHSTGGPLYPFSFEKNPLLKTPVVRYDEGGHKQDASNPGGYTDEQLNKNYQIWKTYDPTGGLNFFNYIASQNSGNLARGEENEYWKEYLGLNSAVPLMNSNAYTEWDKQIEAQKTQNGELTSDFYGTTPRMDYNIQALADTLMLGNMVRNYEKYDKMYDLPHIETITQAYEQAKNILNNPNQWTFVDGEIPIGGYRYDSKTSETNPLGMLSHFGMKWVPEENALYMHDTYDFPNKVYTFTDIPVRPREMKIRSRINFDPIRGSWLLRSPVNYNTQIPVTVTK